METNTINKKGKYDKLDDNGFIKEGEYITDSDTIVGKCYKSKNSDGKEITNSFGSSTVSYTHLTLPTTPYV